jgi:hypothetical protein
LLIGIYLTISGFVINRTMAEYYNLQINLSNGEKKFPRNYLICYTLLYLVVIRHPVASVVVKVATLVKLCSKYLYFKGFFKANCPRSHIYLNHLQV